MEEQRLYTQRFAMLYGTYMGVYWILILSFLPSALTRPNLLLIVLLGMLSVPFVGYYFARQFRNKVCEGYISYLQALVFLSLMFVFAALLNAVANYIYFRYIDHGYLFDRYEQMVETLINAEVPGMQAYTDGISQALEQLRSASPIQLVMSILTNNVMNGFFMSLVIALFVVRRKPVS